MKRVLILLSLIAAVMFAIQAISADKSGIKKNVDAIITAIDEGQDPQSYVSEATLSRVFILEETGNLLVHPTMTGKDLKMEDMQMFEALKVSTPDGQWIVYRMDGKEKNIYVRKTKNNLTVGGIE